jgi:hypothetical protein
MYHFLLQEKENPVYEKVSSLGNFERYLDWVIHEESPYPKGATKLQKSMLIDENGEIGVDRIGRFEQLHDDFSDITRELGISATLPKLNGSKHKRYVDYYDTRTRKLVENHFAEDIDLFKYTFN